MSDKKKAALSSFFAKNKSKRKGANGTEAGADGEGGRGGDHASSGFGILGDSGASGWVEESPAADAAAIDVVASAAVKAHLHMHIGDFTDDNAPEDEEDAIRQKIEAEEAKEALAKARRKAQAAAAAAAAGPAPAVPTAGVLAASGASTSAGAGGGAWVPAHKRTTTAATDKSKPVDVRNTEMFPTLGGAKHTAGGAGGGGGGGLAELGTANPWHALAGGEEEEDEEEAAAEAEAAEAARAAAAAAEEEAKKKSVSFSASTSGGGGGKAGAGAGAAAVPIDAATGLYAGVGKEYATPADVKAEVTKVVNELRLSGEYAEALRRLTEMRVVPLSLRSFVVGAALQGALDSTAFAERSRVGKLLAALVPAKVLTRAMLNEGVTAWMAGWADHKEDCPKIADMLSMVFGTGLLVGTLKEGMAAGGAGGAAAALPPHDAEAIRAGGYVKVECIHPELAAALKLPAPQLRLAGTALPKRADEEEEAAPAPAPAAAAARPVTPPVDDEDDGGVVVKKKKKKAVRAAEEEED